MEGDGGLPAPRAAEDHQRLVGRSTHGGVLVGVQESGHVRAGPPLLCADAEPEVSGAGCCPGPTGSERVAPAYRPAPVRAPPGLEPLAQDLEEPPPVDDDDPPHLDHAPRLATGERLLERVPLAVPVEELRNG